MKYIRDTNGNTAFRMDGNQIYDNNKGLLSYRITVNSVYDVSTGNLVFRIEGK